MDNEKILTNERGLLTTMEAAQYLGVKPSYLYKMMMRRTINITRHHSQEKGNKEVGYSDSTHKSSV